MPKPPKTPVQVVSQKFIVCLLYVVITNRTNRQAVELLNKMFGLIETNRLYMSSRGWQSPVVISQVENLSASNKRLTRGRQTQWSLEQAA